MLTKSQTLYNTMAPFYDEYRSRKQNFLNSIDEIIISYVKNVDIMLDIGSGNGKRGYKISKKLKVKMLILTDNSSEMIRECKKLADDGISIVQIDALNINKLNLDKKPELITCLSNVLAHVDKPENRMNALVSMRKVLSDKGVLFMDVNNRYNWKNYGKINVFRNIIKDLISPRSTNGDYDFVMNINNSKIPATAHIFNPLEIELLIKKSGLKILRKFFIDYDSGKIVKNFWNGQILYILAK